MLSSEAIEYIEYINAIDIELTRLLYTNTQNRKHIIRKRNINGYYCITDFCKAECKIVGNYLRNKMFTNIIHHKQLEYNIPLFYYQLTEDSDLMGTWLHPEMMMNFYEWLCKNR